MRFEKSNYYHLLDSKKVTLPTGDFYFLDSFCIAEINEGVHIGTEECQDMAIALVNHYSEDLKIGFVSNRINSFSMDLRQCVKFHKDYDFITAKAIVYYDDLNFNIATIEKRLSHYNIKRCYTLDIAIKWMLKLKEFKSIATQC